MTAGASCRAPLVPGRRWTTRSKTPSPRSDHRRQVTASPVCHCEVAHPHRLRAQAIVLAVCLWSVCAVDFATPGLFDRAGNIKFQDFLPDYVSAQLIAHGRSS